MASKNVITLVILLVLGVVVFGVLIEQAAYQTTATSIINDSITFTANDTYYPFERVPVASITSVVNDTLGSCTYGTGQYTFQAMTGIKVYANDTDDPTGGVERCPNMTTGNALYVTYALDKPDGVGGIIVPLLVGIVAIVVLLLILGKA